VHFARVYAKSNAAKYFTIADAGVKIIYYEHETID